MQRRSHSVPKTPPPRANKFCTLADLGNEATVEQFFVSPLLADLGYRNNQIKPKTSLDELAVNEGRRKLKYKPDYALLVAKKLRWIVEAKAAKESLADHIGQCSGYCLALNRLQEDNPVEFFLITNGVVTELYQWDRESPILSLNFDDFQDGNPKYERLCELLSPSAFVRRAPPPAVPSTHVLRRCTIEEVNAIFSWCHQFIHRKDDLSQSDAFMEFVKIVFLKLLSDKAIHDLHPDFTDKEEIEVPASEVRFSKRWIDARQGDHANPLDALQFQTLLTELEEQIKRGSKKRIFSAGDHLILKAETIAGVVAKLEGVDLYGIDADLNGRLFETFLNATMRGKDLGQYFTPRSVVKLAVRLANIKVGRDHTDIVLDACSGTGGFLIDALADMWRRATENSSLSKKELASLKDLIATKRVYGIDAARGPALSRIARMNMYLHGDGGSSVFQADSLDKECLDDLGDAPEIKAEKEELRRLLKPGGFAHVVLTNPPFAKECARKDGKRDSRILDGYKLAWDTSDGKRKAKPSLKSSLMFVERYYDMLLPGGRMITVIDDSILGGSDYKVVRDFIREHYLVRAVVSLPGDAFQRSNARVKTSLLYLEKKRDPLDEQPPIFMHYCTTIGLDDPARKRVLPIDRENRKLALAEIAAVGLAFDEFMTGNQRAAKWTVPASAIVDRMDVKSCLLKPYRLSAKWKKGGIDVGVLADWVEVLWPLPDPKEPSGDYIDGSEDQSLQYLRVRYDGFGENGDEKDTSGGGLYRVHTDDLVISNINAVHGAVAVVPASLDGAVVTSEFTVCRAKAGVDPLLVWMLLRSPEARSDLLILATGIGRTRVRWANAAALKLPKPTTAMSAAVLAALKEAEQKEAEAAALRVAARDALEIPLHLNNKKALEILAAFKPPQ